MKRYGTTPLQIRIGEDLKAIRIKAKLGLADAAALTGKAAATLSTIESGKQNITLGMLDDIVSAYDRKLVITFKSVAHDTV